MPNLELLGPLMERLYHDFVSLYYLMLPICFALSLVMTWLRSPQGSPEFMDSLTRVIVTTLILAAFPEISKTILFVANGIAERIDSTAGLEQVIEAARQKVEGYGSSGKSVLIAFNDLIIATLSFGSFLILYCARYLMIAIYHFYWVFYMVAAPILLLCNVFAGTAHITKNLFKGMIEVACWKIVWAILGAMLAALSFGDAYQAEGSYLVLIVMNFVIAIAMLMTPSIVKSLVGGGMQSMSSAIGAASVAAMAAAPARAATIAATSRTAINSAGNFVHSKIEARKTRQAEERKRLMY